MRCSRWLAAVVAVVLLAAPAMAQDVPPPPPGPGDDGPPPPPPGPGDDGPPPPPGPGDDGAPPPPPGPAETQPAKPAAKAPGLTWLGLAGFWEVRGGIRTQHDKYQKDASLGETRLQLKYEKPVGPLRVKVTADFLYDAVDDHHTVRLERGTGWLDLREASVGFTPADFMDVKVGRQILTWGTGDLLFINDLFPKDWRSFFIGRDVEYLKAPSDAMKVSLFTGLANVDVVVTPRFDPDRFIRGRRLSYWNGALGRVAGRDAVVDPHLPDEWFDDAEWATRVSKNLGGTELAGYGYWGYWKSPAGMDPASGKATFPRLSVYGASVRGQAAGGIANAEAGYYDSRQDRPGDDPFKANSQVRLLAGYERDLPRIARDLTVGVQYYVELMMEYDAYRRGLAPGAPAADEDRHVLTARIRKLLMNQNLTVSLFAYFSPTDADAYLRPNVKYKIDDHWTVEAGGNVMLGSERHTFFGQFRDNSNLYAALRYGF